MGALVVIGLVVLQLVILVIAGWRRDHTSPFSRAFWCD